MPTFQSKYFRYTALLLMPVVFLFILGAVFIGTVNRHVEAERKIVEKPEKGLVYKNLRATEKEHRCKGKLAIVNEAGETTGCTHGPDPTPEGLTVAYQPAPVIQARPQNGTNVRASSSIVCAGDGISGRRFEVIYARASDKPDRYAQYLDSFRQYMGTANELIRQSGLQTGQARNVRFVTEPVAGGCQVAVRNAVLPPTGDDSIYETRKELRNLGYTNPDYKYVVLADANVYCGIAEFWFDDYPSPDNYSNRNLGGSMYSRIDTACWDSGTTIAHEMVHSMGGVQDTAPNATAGGHCRDEYDTMCYQDSPDEVMQYVCASTQEQRLDCNKNDYFNTAPAAGSYLDTYWNVARNSYLIKGDAADNTAPVVTFGTLVTGSHVRGNVNPALSIVDGEELMRVRLYVDGVIANQDALYPFTDLLWLTSNFTQGSHTLRADAVDATGNVGSTATITVTVDNSAPSAPANVRTTLVTPSRVDLAWNNSTDNIGVDSYSIKRDGVVIGTSTTNSFSDTTVSQLRGYNYQVQAKDKAGNAADSQVLYVSVPGTPDTEAPAVTINGPTGTDFAVTDGLSGALNITATVTDNQAVGTVEFYVNNILYGYFAGSNGSYTTQWFSVNLDPGTYSLTAKAYDLSGNSRTSTSVNVTLAVPVHRLFRQDKGRHFYTGSNGERDAAAQGPYRYEDVAFYGGPTSSNGFVPVYRLYSEAASSHFYTADAAERDYAATIGYRYEGIAFHASPGSSAGKYAPVYRLYNANLGTHFYTASVGERDYALTIGYKYEGVAFYALAAQPSSIAPVYRLYSSYSASHFYTASKPEHDAALRAGYASEGVRYYAKTAPAYGLSPVYRLYNPASRAHFYTISTAERDAAVSNYGFTNEGVAFYGSSGSGYGQVPVYRLHKPATGKHFFTSNYGEMLVARAAGYTYEGYAYFAID